MTSEDFAAFALRLQPRLVGALTLYCGDPGVAEELAQDTLVRARERWARVTGADRPDAYVHRIAINLANSRYRRSSAERRAVRRLAAGTDATTEDPCGADGVAVRMAVASLPPRQREVVVRRWFLDEDVADVGSAMGISPSAVRSATTRALVALRAELDVDLLDPEEARDGA